MQSHSYTTDGTYFKRVDELARKENLSKEERREYERNLKFYRDYQNHYDQGMRLSHEKGREEGIIEGHAAGVIEGHTAGVIEGHAAGIFEQKMRFARELVLCGYPLEEIARLTRLPLEEIEKLRQS